MLLQYAANAYKLSHCVEFLETWIKHCAENGVSDSMLMIRVKQCEPNQADHLIINYDFKHSIAMHLF